jgi:DNA (cytosine-5)-methyltransferase 1
MKNCMYRLIDLFCGAGGMSLGFSEAFGHKFRLVWANDMDQDAMVRRLIGSLVEVGRGRASVEDFARLIENPRSQSPLVPARVTAPPSGLFMESVDY